jgi:hypothetical protein
MASLRMPPPPAPSAPRPHDNGKHVQVALHDILHRNKVEGAADVCTHATASNIENSLACM